MIATVAYRRVPRVLGSALLGAIVAVSVARGSSDSGTPAQPPQTTPQAYPPEQVDAGQTLFAAQCGFCHGRDATGGQTGPDLIESTLVAEDVGGDKIGPIVRNGRPEKGMPPFSMSDPDLAAVVAFIHTQKAKLDAQPGRRRRVTESDLLSGNAEAGKQYFSGAGRCVTCHSASGDLAGVGTRFRGLALLQQMLYPRRAAAGPAAAAAAATAGPVKVTVTLPSGATVAGSLAYRDEFTIALTDASGWYRSWPANQVKYTVTNPLEAHVEQLAKYTDADMHNVYAYLQTLR
jgi:cytochrome c oxidase cbb3-type subunit III